MSSETLKTYMKCLLTSLYHTYKPHVNGIDEFYALGQGFSNYGTCTNSGKWSFRYWHMKAMRKIIIQLETVLFSIFLYDITVYYHHIFCQMKYILPYVLIKLYNNIENSF